LNENSAVTFSIVARCAQPQMFGMAIASSSPAVAARCAWARAGAGAVATQNMTDPALGPYILDLLAQGATAQTALHAALGSTDYADYRQLLVLGMRGPPLVHSGSRALGVAGSALGADCSAAGNLLAHPDVPAAMVAAFNETGGHLGDRLLEALSAGMARGGEAGPIHSAGLLIVREVSWPIVDLRVDWSEQQPIAELRDIWRIYAPQIDAYVGRALDPEHAPAFGVSGDP
jgi:uncharacterized Ntn-hydrolase superfamily protein